MPRPTTSNTTNAHVADPFAGILAGFLAGQPRPLARIAQRIELTALGRTAAETPHLLDVCPWCDGAIPESETPEIVGGRLLHRPCYREFVQWSES